MEKGKERLKDTAFVTGKQFSQNDINALKRFYQDVFDYQKNKFGENGAVFNRPLMEHLLLSERFAEHTAPILGLNIYVLKAVMLTHDFGRTFSHRRGRNNTIENTLFDKLGFDKQFRQLLPSDTLWTGVEKESVQQRLEMITAQADGITGAVELIDVLAKWEDKNTGELRKWNDVISISQVAQNAPDPKTMWPSELTRQKIITSQEGNEAMATKYNFLKNWFEEKSNIKIDDLISKVEVSLKAEPLKQTWA